MIMILTRNYIPGDDLYIYFINREKFGNSTRSRESRAGFLKKSGFTITNSNLFFLPFFYKSKISLTCSICIYCCGDFK